MFSEACIQKKAISRQDCANKETNQNSTFVNKTEPAIGTFHNDEHNITKSSALLSRTPNLRDSDQVTMRRTLRHYFLDTFNTYESLFDCLASENAFYIKPISLRHPLIFYYGHTATFFINKLLLARLINERVDQRMESIFAVGVDEMSWDDLNEANYDWPSVHDVKAYRDKVRTLVLDLIDHAPLHMPIDWENPWWAIIMGIEHERIHLETSSVLIRQHDLSMVKSSPNWQPNNYSGVAPENQLIHVAAGKVRLAKDKTSPFYGWDNEYGVHDAEITAFEASKFLVSNQEFLEFVEAKGYQTAEYWTEEGQGWLQFTNAEHPTFWRKAPDGWYLRLMTEEVCMPWDWPVEVNYHEAKAFCNWKKQQTGHAVRLPTEDEWYRLYDIASIRDVGAAPAQANIHLDHGASSCPVNQFAQGEFYDVVGNVWQWTETPIYPFEGFEVHPIYDDFSTPTFDERHNLIKGGSWISTGNESLHSARYAFRRHFFQHAGFRYVISGEINSVPASHYETDKLMSEYAEFHYGDEYFGVPNFSKALVELAVATLTKHQLDGLPKHTALDLGCASGRATFELARYFDQVTGVDFSARFIGQAVQLAKGETLRYTLIDEGELVSYKSRSLAGLKLEDTKHKVGFFQGDACNLKPVLTGYDFILAANLIDRLYDPAKFLSSIHERLNVGGVLMLASPYTWLSEHTPRKDWIGGFKKDGETFTTSDGLQALLSKHFCLIQEPQEIPFVIRETKRKFQHTLSEVTFWQRTA
ncbi:5-histidylcysteine sulfoxide synthase [Alkanindiges illinoisensis]|uniref:5-histidylcysteine sulfoxide synthase n=1 Tax=Alkanindiges illinoisensis TaxID=197183 RepID=A0A4Y7XFR9_9GAMM|nr:5-histidylcysteine sulfoxide synthase [Alkanindiges illinoisensis]TEU30342.1 5-histidylcysteine sulfoxide synthase [Alkanindiges illinoisensis]